VALNVVPFVSFPALISNYKYFKKASVEAFNYINLLGFLPELASFVTAFFFCVFLIGFKGDLAAAVSDPLSFAVFALFCFIIGFFVGSNTPDIDIGLAEAEAEAEAEDLILSALVIGGVLAEVR